MASDAAMAAPLCQPLRSIPDIDRAVGRGLQQRTFTAAQAVASVQGGIFQRGAYGTPQAQGPKVALSHEALFDLGALTMPLSTALAAMVLVANRRLDITKSVAQILPDFSAAPFDAITLDMLLDHSSGLPHTAELSTALLESDLHVAPNEKAAGTRAGESYLREGLQQVPLLTPPGEATLVSDLGYLLLGWVIEHVVSSSLDVFLQAEVYGPLGLEDALIFPGTSRRKRTGIQKKHMFVQSGRCPQRKQICCGEVLDVVAWNQGGVAGHAGLFGTASGVWRLAQTLLLTHQGERTLFHTGTLKRFWTRSRRFETTRTLGWDTPTVLGSSAGKRLSRTAVGHVCKGGPSLWIDPQNQTVGVLLFNAQDPQDVDGLQRVRARFFELVAHHAAAGPPAPDLEEAWADLLRR